MNYGILIVIRLSDYFLIILRDYSSVLGKCTCGSIPPRVLKIFKSICNLLCFPTLIKSFGVGNPRSSREASHNTFPFHDSAISKSAYWDDCMYFLNESIPKVP